MREVDHELRQQLRLLFGEGRLREGLAFVNLLTPYRFTALFHIDGEDLHNLILVDRTRQETPRLDTIPLGDSYCTYVRELRDAFIVTDSLHDARVDGHPKRPVVHAYLGIPLVNAEGRVFGTVCHFDFDPVEPPEDALEWLGVIADFLDPREAAIAMREKVDERIDALESMLGLLLEVSPDRASAIEVFEEYARPLRGEASTLHADLRNALESRIDELLQQLTHMAAANPHTDTPTSSLPNPTEAPNISIPSGG